MRLFLLSVIVFFISSNAIAQFTITGSVNSSSYSCASFSGNNTIYIGDGTTPTNLVMNQDLNLHNSCALGPIHFVIRANATVDFSPGNNRLTLPAGSSIEIEPGGGFVEGSCTASERIYIGTTLLASCNGKATALYDFDELVANGGYNFVSYSVAPLCGPGTATIAVSVAPTPSASTTYNLFTAASGGSAIATVTANTSPYSASIVTPSISSTTTYYVSATTGSATTLRRAVVVTVNPLPVITTQPLNQLDCEGATVRFRVIASGAGLTYSWQRKRPSDADFVTMTDTESNTDYTQTDNLRIGNVGSAQYPEGTQFRVIVSSGNCSVISNTATLTVNEITDVSGATNATQCSGTNYSYTVSTSHPANVVTYRWKKSVTSGIWDDITDGGAYSGATTATLTITGGTPAESGLYRAYVSFQSSGTDCSVDSSTRSRRITFLPDLATPETTITQPNCMLNTGTIVVTIQNLTDTYSFDNGLNFHSNNVATGLTPGTYSVMVRNQTGCISPARICQIVSAVTTWDGTNWLNGNPDATKAVVFEQNFNSTTSIEACSCQITNGASVVINPEHTLTVINAVAVLDGTLTFENNASLVQINDAAINTGSIQYKRHTAPVRRHDFTYWSSPVEGQTLKNLSPNTLYDKYYSYNNGWVISYNGIANMDKGKGYSIRAPQTFSLTTPEIDYSPLFVGVPHNGIVALNLIPSQSYLLGNPYPSAIDADAFLDFNINVLEGTLYFWTHNSLPSTDFSGAAKYNYTSSDYAMYNRTGAVGTRISTAVAATTGVEVPTGQIAAGQGFFAPASAAGGTVVFNNSMRVAGGVLGTNNSQFFKTEAVAKATPLAETTKNRIWLNLTNNQGVFKQMLVGYVPKATNDYDAGFDGVTYSGNSVVDFYSLNNAVNLSIQGRALPFTAKDSVVLGYKSTLQGQFQISIDRADGVLANQNVFLEDTQLQLLHDLKKEPYKFLTEKGTFNQRFVLRYEDANAEENLAQETSSPLASAVWVTAKSGSVAIHTSEILLDKVAIYDVTGRKLYQKDKIGEQQLDVPLNKQIDKVLLVVLSLQDGTKLSKKLLLSAK